MFFDYFKLAFGNLKHRGLRSWLTMLGIFIGIAAVVALISLGAGLKTAITGQFGALSVDTLTIQNKQTSFAPPGSAVVEKLTDKDLEIVRNTRGVINVIPRLLRVVEIEYNEVSRFSYVTDLPENSEAAREVYNSLDLAAEEGRLLREKDIGKILLGNDFKNENIFGKEIRIGNKLNINDKDFEVVGILKKGSSFQVNGIIIIPNKDLKELLEIENELDFIVAKIQDKNKIEEVANELERKFRNDRDEKIGEETFQIQTPIESLSAVNTILNIVNIIVISIALISLFVGGVGITNTMYTSVLERRKEIGIMKAIGAKNKDIFFVFLIESGLLGLTGGIIGAGIGLGMAFLASSAANMALGTTILAVEVSYPLLAEAIGFAFFVGIISGTLPAFQAGKLNVVDALRS